MGLRNLAQEPVGFESGSGPKGLGKLSPGFSLGGITINAISPEGAEEIVVRIRARSIWIAPAFSGALTGLARKNNATQAKA